MLDETGHSVFRLRAGDDSAVERWRDAPCAQLVTAGRFDGLDFPDDVCRLVIIPSVPAASSEFERFTVAYLGDAAYMRHRVGQRVTQAPRANRTAGDSALYVGLDPAFGGALAESAVRASLGSDVQADVRTALELHGGGWEPVEVAAAEFWRTHRNADTPTEVAPKSRPGRRVAGRRSPRQCHLRGRGHDAPLVGRPRRSVTARRQGGGGPRSSRGARAQRLLVLRADEHDSRILPADRGAPSHR